MSRTRRRLAALAPTALVVADVPGGREALALADAGEDWRPAVAALKAHCSTRPASGAPLEILLSHAFVRFLAVPWSAALATTAAQYLASLFDAVHGSRASGWHCVAEQRLAAEPRLAAGIERELVDGLGECAAACGARLASVAPWIVPAFARQARGRKRPEGWFAAIEPGWLALASVRGGAVRDVTRAPYEGAADAALERAVRRQSLREGVEGELHVWTAGRADGIEAWMELAA